MSCGPAVKTIKNRHKKAIKFEIEHKTHTWHNICIEKMPQAFYVRFKDLGSFFIAILKI